MVKTCVAENCTNDTRFLTAGSNISFHKFPLNKNPQVLKAWLDIIPLKSKRNRTNPFIPTKHHCLCSDHFRETDFHPSPRIFSTGRRFLKPFAVPSIFNVSGNEVALRKEQWFPNEVELHVGLGGVNLKCDQSIQTDIRQTDILVRDIGDDHGNDPNNFTFECTRTGDVGSNMAGNFNKRIKDPSNISIADFHNPYNFYSVLSQSDADFFEWLRKCGLLCPEDTFRCEKCGSKCKLCVKSNRRIGYVFRCVADKNHDYTITKYSFFERSKFEIRDILVFIRSYIDCGGSLKVCAFEAGISYKNTAVDWAKFVRDVFVEVVCREYKTLMLKGDVEIYEMFFIPSVKSKRSVWIFGLVERESNKLVLLPVSAKDEDNLLKVLRNFVLPGSHLFTNSWSVSDSLKDAGFENVSRLGKWQTKKRSNKGPVKNHITNTEHAWTQAKGCLKKIFGSKAPNFESYICEIVWRNWRSGPNMLSNFFLDVQSFFPLTGPCQYSTERPIFQEWICGDTGSVDQAGDKDDNTPMMATQVVAEVENESNIEAHSPTSSSTLSGAEDNDQDLDSTQATTTALLHGQVKLEIEDDDQHLSFLQPPTVASKSPEPLGLKPLQVFFAPSESNTTVPQRKRLSDSPGCTIGPKSSKGEFEETEMNNTAEDDHFASW